MNRLSNLTATQLGALCAAVAVTFFSFNDVLMKFLSGSYALHQVVMFRSAIGLAIVIFFIAPLTDGWAVARTKRLKVHMLRGLCVVASNMAFFLGLAAMPLADAVAIFFVSPLLITVFSVIFLGELVGVRRWSAIAVGFAGVLIMLRPGTEAFQFASLLPLVAAVFYATIHILTRKIGGTESAATMAFYIQFMFLLVCIAMGLAVGDGRFGDQTDPSLAFLLREWSWPLVSDYLFLGFIGICTGFGGYLISQAYRVGEASFVAPFEYLALPMSVVWGMIVFAEFPDALDYLGMALILGAGLFTVWREAQVKDLT
ncbi:DMT family transporter [Yoonia sediminilitoris]|uniref:EamA-like transporter family protein n=1 Tax=Yoonia sediminilitoris TaxID=1286148 RepID=A0A2T6KIN6_9RHOB|nr:DMT family transporter [Yoonia sediminilitoris]PUB15577.1 EamA-like transporter family protein [Yoonia sediminilitoris]RCW96186.1 EamA-like transporter family protein [Yoonia sediminilitoris]